MALKKLTVNNVTPKTIGTVRDKVFQKDKQFVLRWVASITNQEKYFMKISSLVYLLAHLFFIADHIQNTVTDSIDKSLTDGT